MRSLVYDLLSPLQIWADKLEHDEDNIKNITANNIQICRIMYHLDKHFESVKLNVNFYM